MMKHKRLVGDNSVLVAMVLNDIFVVNEDYTYRSIAKNKTFTVHEFMEVVKDCEPIQINDKSARIALVIYEDISDVLDAYNIFRKTENKKQFFQNLILNGLEI